MHYNKPKKMHDEEETPSMNKVQVAEMVKKEVRVIRATADLPTIPPDMEGDLVKLAHDSRDILGYSVLHQKAVLGGSRLANVLIELGIEVLSPEAILKYQMKMGRPNPHLVRLVQTGGGIIPEQDKDASDEDDDEVDDEGDEEDTPTVHGRLTNFAWVRLEISEYSRPIPVHVLSKAIEIKKALPTTQFYVEELKHMPDPFLVAEFMREQFYIEVWEEPAFEKRATKDAISKGRKSKS